MARIGFGAGGNGADHGRAADNRAAIVGRIYDRKYVDITAKFGVGGIFGSGQESLPETAEIGGDGDKFLGGRAEFLFIELIARESFNDVDSGPANSGGAAGSLVYGDFRLDHRGDDLFNRPEFN